MLESPDYFFRVREIGRLRQTTFHSGCIGVGKRGAAAGQKASEVPCNFTHLVRTNAFRQAILLGMYCK